jgi:hypothetical protein
MHTLTTAQKANCSYVYSELMPKVAEALVAPTEEDKVYETLQDDGKWRIRVHWFPSTLDHPPLLEVSVTRTDPTKGKTLHYWFYLPNTGCDTHPPYGAWRVHAWVG